MVRVVLLIVCLACVQLAASQKCGSEICGPTECCKVGRGRFPIPGCHPLGEVDKFCYLHNPSPGDFTLQYPDGSKAIVKGGYLEMCPCKPGLVCKRPTSTCQLP